jgi:peptidoglycan/xylan/chitin deacetylase (PgdA/CDA1 family)
VRETSQAVIKLIRVSGSRAARTVSVAAAGSLFPMLTVLAIASAAASDMGLPATNGSSPSPSDTHAIAGTSERSATATVRTTDTAPPTAGAPHAPPATALVGGAAPTASCLPGYEGMCGSVPAPTPLPSITAGTGRAFAVHVTILEYHRVKPDAGETGYVADLITPPDVFQAQMAAMYVAGWHTITMGELGDDLRLGIQPAPKSFAVTFDDGYEDGYIYALPILRQFGFVATYFVVGSQIGQPEHLTASELRDLLAAGSEIGNHTMNHVDLLSKTPERMRSEVYDASALIARLIGVWPQSFSYPMGGTSAGAAAAVAATPGIETAVVQEGSSPETWANRLRLPRMRVGPGTSPQFLVDHVTGQQP